MNEPLKSDSLAEDRPSETQGYLERVKRWLRSHHTKLIGLEDTPHSIALGCAIGVFF